MNYPIEDIEGIGPAFAEKLNTAGVTKTGDLLDKCATPAGRKAKAIAGQSGISEVNERKNLTRQVPSATQVAKWVEQAKEFQPILTY